MILDPKHPEGHPPSEIKTRRKIGSKGRIGKAEVISKNTNKKAEEEGLAF